MSEQDITVANVCERRYKRLYTTSNTIKCRATTTDVKAITQCYRREVSIEVEKATVLYRTAICVLSGCEVFGRPSHMPTYVWDESDEVAVHIPKRAEAKASNGSHHLPYQLAHTPKGESKAGRAGALDHPPIHPSPAMRATTCSTSFHIPRRAKA